MFILLTNLKDTLLGVEIDQGLDFFKRMPGEGHETFAFYYRLSDLSVSLYKDFRDLEEPLTSTKKYESIIDRYSRYSAIQIVHLYKYHAALIRNSKELHKENISLLERVIEKCQKEPKCELFISSLQLNLALEYLGIEDTQSAQKLTNKACEFRERKYTRTGKDKERTFLARALLVKANVAMKSRDFEAAIKSCDDVLSFLEKSESTDNLYFEQA